METLSKRIAGKGRASLLFLYCGMSFANRFAHTMVCILLHMATNLAIDDALIEEARRIGGQKTKRAAVTEALHEYIQRRKQQRIVELFGKIDVDPQYSYKAQRRQ